MNSIRSLLSTTKDQPLISYHGQTETQVSFAQRVDSLAADLQTSAPWQDHEFVMLTETDPIAFLALLLALWENGHRVILPTRDYYSNPGSIPYYAYAVYVRNNRVHSTANPDFVAAQEPGEGNVIAFSSGSTGVPKGILHNHTHFLANARAVSARIEEKGATSLTFLKPYLVSALSHFFVHFLTGSHLCFEDYENVHALSKYYTGSGDIGIVGSPMHLTSALQFIPRSAAPRFFFSSGDFLSALCINRILNSFPKAVIYNVYGLAELAGRFFINRIDSNTPDGCFETIGTPIEGTRHRLDDGQLLVNSDFLFKGYIRQGHFEAAAKWHPSQDLARQGDHGLFLIGRADDEVKVLGNKVSLKHIENRIKSVLQRDVAVTLASEHPHFGNILSLVLDDGTGLSRTDLIRQLRTHLEPYEIPHQFFIMDEIPFTQSMKIDRAAIADRLDSLRAIV